MNKRISLTVGTIIIIIAAGVAGFLVWKKSNIGVEQKDETMQQQVNQQQEYGNGEQETIDMNNWKTYRNDEFGFEIRYPNRWKIELLDGKTERRFNFERDVPRTVKLVLTKSNGDPAITKNYSSLAVQFTDWFDISKEVDYGGDGGLKNIETKTIRFGGRDAIIPSKYHEYYMKGCGNSYILTVKPAPRNWGEFNAITVNTRCEDLLEMKNIIESAQFY